MANLRFGAVEEAFKKRPLEVAAPTERPGEFYGKYVFNRTKMYKYLPVDIYNKLVDVMDNGIRLDRSIADAVAEGMKRWAEEHGATHYTHWFQPLTEGTAEKHDAFIEHDGKGGCSKSSQVNCSYSKNLMQVHSLMAAFVTPLKQEDTLHGTQQVLYSSLTIHSVSLPSLYPIQVKHLIIKLHFLSLFVQLTLLQQEFAITLTLKSSRFTPT